MSIWTDCTQAIHELCDDPKLHAKDHRGFFTDLDVVARASRIGGIYSEGQTRRALIEANNALGKLYKIGQVARFGPVQIPGIEQIDYARIATRIVHADPNGPTFFETPNGKFKRLMVFNDTMRIGRRFVTNRDDRQPWSEQDEVDEGILRAKLAAHRQRV